MALVYDTNFLLKSLINKQHILSQLSPSLPFCLFKLPKTSDQNEALSQFSNISLPINRFLNPETLTSRKLNFGVWSESHLDLIVQMHPNNLIDPSRFMISSPYKTEGLIKRSLVLGIRQMLVEDFDELYKIHRCRCEGENTVKNLDFIWNLEDISSSLQQIQKLASYSIQLKGLFFNANVSKDMNKVQNITESILKMGHQIRKVYLEGSSKQISEINLEFSKRSKFFDSKRISSIISLKDHRETSDYMIACKVLGHDQAGRPIFSEEVMNYVSNSTLLSGSTLRDSRNIIEGSGNKKWVVSPISYYPHHEIMDRHMQQGYIKDLIC